jgi:hypothetical protein
VDKVININKMLTLLLEIPKGMKGGRREGERREKGGRRKGEGREKGGRREGEGRGARV